MKLRYRPGAFAPRTPCGGGRDSLQMAGPSPPPKKNSGDATEYRSFNVTLGLILNCKIQGAKQAVESCFKPGHILLTNKSAGVSTRQSLSGGMYVLGMQ